MNQRIRKLSCFAIILFLMPVLAFAQSQNTIYIQLDYMKVKPGEANQYVQIEQEIFKPIHEERINSGTISFWALADALYTEPGADYDYITVNVFDDLSKLESFYDFELIESIHPDMPLETIMQRTVESREVVHSEVWQLVDFAVPDNGFEPTRYLAVNYYEVAPGSDNEYLTVEQEYWKPIHEYRIENDMLAAWRLYSLVTPLGNTVKYNYLTADYYHSLGDLGQILTPEILSSVHPQIPEHDLNTFLDRTLNARAAYRTILLEVIDYVSPAGN